MNLLHVINSTDPRGGGPIEAILQAYAALRDKGHDMEMVCVDEPDAPWLKDMPLRIHALGPARGKYRYADALEPWLRENASRFDAVLVHGIWLYPSYAVYKALASGQTPYFVYTHGMMDPTFKKLFPLKHIYKSICWRLREHRVMKKARAVFFTCEEEKRLAESSFQPFEHADAIVPYCVGEPPGDVEKQRKAFSAAYPDLHGKRLLLFLSRIHKKKGCDLLIEAFGRVAKEDATAHLVVAGPDSTRWQSTLEARAEALGIADRITWTGMLEGDLKWGAFRSAEAFVLPSHQENFGIAVVEALACEVPVLITNRINIWREIESDGAGIVAKPSVRETEHMLRQWLLMKAPDRAAMRRHAASCFATRFRSAEAAENLLAVLESYGVNI